MHESIVITVNGRPITVPSGTTVAVAVAMAGTQCRRSVTGEVRSAFCGMGICFECRVKLDGKPHCSSCQILCQPGMEVTVDD